MHHARVASWMDASCIRILSEPCQPWSCLQGQFPAGRWGRKVGTPAPPPGDHRRCLGALPRFKERCQNLTWHHFEGLGFLGWQRQRTCEPLGIQTLATELFRRLWVLRMRRFTNMRQHLRARSEYGTRCYGSHWHHVFGSRTAPDQRFLDLRYRRASLFLLDSLG